MEHLKLAKDELHGQLETEKKMSQGKSWQLEKYEREKKEREEREKACLLSESFSSKYKV